MVCYLGNQSKEDIRGFYKGLIELTESYGIEYSQDEYGDTIIGNLSSKQLEEVVNKLKEEMQDCIEQAKA